MRTKKLIVTKYVGDTNTKPSGYMCRTGGYKSKRISYAHGAHDPGEHAAMRYVKEVVLPYHEKQAKRHGRAAPFIAAHVEVYGLPDKQSSAYVVTIVQPDALAVEK